MKLLKHFPFITPDNNLGGNLSRDHNARFMNEEIKAQERGETFIAGISWTRTPEL